ncbi:hypothetical protein RRG08_040257 [Elysia crispata]|uniref:Uncharacterized protein n=1 Tax=Elysia crispata TaxID=231223 RepID=A0AAE0YAR3_9GAST|nr:hypothetical protein RRG08_040257 [Elysia crispata]
MPSYLNHISGESSVSIRLMGLLKRLGRRSMTDKLKNLSRGMMGKIQDYSEGAISEQTEERLAHGRQGSIGGWTSGDPLRTPSQRMIFNRTLSEG